MLSGVCDGDGEGQRMGAGALEKRLKFSIIFALVQRLLCLFGCVCSQNSCRKLEKVFSSSECHGKS